MDGTLGRTSVTVDEAVAILLGWAKGPILYTSSNENLSDEEQDALDSLTFSLTEELEKRLDSCESDWEEAKIDGLSEVVIAEKRAAFDRQQEVARLASTYLCAVNDEINKGEQSALRVDRKLSNPVYTYITLTSLHEWAKDRYDKPIFNIVESTPATVVPKPEKSVPRQKMRDQEVAILRVIKELNYSPKSLPHNERGKAGVKARVKAKLATDPSFNGKTSFDKAWDRLRQEKAIADSA